MPAGRFPRRVRLERIERIKAVKKEIVETCEVVAVALPDQLPPEVEQFTRTVGRQDMYPMYLAASRGDLLVSEDLHYRHFAAGLTRVDGSWLQMILAAAHKEGQLDGARYARACAHLAFRRHGNIWIDIDSLMLTFETYNEDEADAVCGYIGAPQADMWSHTALTATFLRRLWKQADPGLKREAFTSRLIVSLVRHRGDEWPVWLALLYIGVEDLPHLRSHVVGWVDGHFLPRRPIEHAAAEWKRYLRRPLRPTIDSGARRPGNRRSQLSRPVEPSRRPDSDGTRGKSVRKNHVKRRPHKRHGRPP